jgi:hypothetical protein
LSNGEQARSRLARQIKDNAVIDDFTSVVNRHVAWAMSNTLHLYTTTTASTHRTTDTDTCCTRTGLTPTVVNRHAAWAMSSSISRFIRRRNFRRVVDAIVYQIRVDKGLIAPKNQKKTTQSLLI